jgi:hypothetical protein
MITVIVILVVAIAIVGALTYTLHKDDDDFLSSPSAYTQEELENIKLAEELYDKDLRPVVDKPKPELEVVEPEFVAKIVKTSKVFPEDATINLEEVKPIKKKRKYYPKKK